MKKEISQVVVFIVLTGIITASAEIRTFVYAHDDESGESIDSVMIVARNITTNWADTTFMVDWPKVCGYEGGLPIRQSMWVPDAGTYEFKAFHPAYFEMRDTISIDEKSGDSRINFFLSRNMDAKTSKFTTITGCVRNQETGESIDSVCVMTNGLNRTYYHADRQIDWDKHGSLPLKTLPVFNSVVFESGLYRLEISAKGFQSISDTLDVPAQGIYKEYYLRPTE